MCHRAVRSPVATRRDLGQPGEVIAQRRFGSEPRGGDRPDGPGRLLEQLLGPTDSPTLQPLHWRRSGLVPESAREGSETHACAPREIRDRERLVQVLLGPLLGLVQGTGSRGVPLDILRVVTVPARWRDHEPRDHLRELRSVVAFDQVQSQVQAGLTSAACSQPPRRDSLIPEVLRGRPDRSLATLVKGHDDITELTEAGARSCREARALRPAAGASRRSIRWSRPAPGRGQDGPRVRRRDRRPPNRPQR